MEIIKGLLAQLVQTNMDIKSELVEVKMKIEEDRKLREANAILLSKMDTRLDVVEKEIAEAANTYKVTKRIFLAIIGIVISIITLNWTNVATNWHLLIGH